MKTKEEKVELLIEAWIDGVDMEGLIDYARHNLERFYARHSEEEVNDFFVESGLEEVDDDSMHH